MKETIMMIHGMWCGEWVWENYKKFFESKGYRCITPVLRHHSGCVGDISANPVGTTSLLDYAQDLEEEIYRLDEKPILMGHSMGGLIAQMLGSRGLAKALVLLTPASPRGIIALRPSVVRSFWSSLTKPAFWRKPIKQTFGEAVYAMMHLLPAGEQRRVYERLVPESGRAGFEMGFWLLDPRQATRVDSSRITCPTLVISGAQDKLTPPSVVRSVANKYKSAATLKEFPGHAHWVVSEPGWEEIAGYCSNWLDEALVKVPRRPVSLVSEGPSPTDKVRKIWSEYTGKWSPSGGKDRRVHRRSDLSVWVEASIPYSGNAQFYDMGVTANISRGGMYIDTDIPVAEGSYLNAHLNLDDSGRPLWVQGRVVRNSDQGVAMEFAQAEMERLSRVLQA